MKRGFLIPILKQILIISTKKDAESQHPFLLFLCLIQQDQSIRQSPEP